MPRKKELCECGGLKCYGYAKCMACQNKQLEVKFCSSCEQTLPVDNFSARKILGKHGQTRYRSNCKLCEAKASKLDRQANPERVKKGKKIYNKANPDKNRNWGLRSGRKQMGIDPDEAERLQKSHNGKCDICGGVNKVARVLAIDHCHTTNKLRGFLCSRCNLGLGQFNDDPNLLSKAIEYLKKQE